MMKSEFEKLAGQEVSSEDYLIIEGVYMYYPGIERKGTVADLYRNFGMVIFNDMIARADKIMKIEQDIQGLNTELQSLKER